MADAVVDENAGDTIIKVITRDINCLSDPNKLSRKRGLQNINKEVFQTRNQLSTEDVEKVFSKCKTAVVKLFGDPAEKCRELAIELVTAYLNATDNTEGLLPVVVPELLRRLGQPEIVEPSEEVRLGLVELLHRLISASGRRNAAYLDDYIRILVRVIIDPYPEVKKKSCQCARVLAKSIPAEFHMMSEQLIKPLLMAISHQHSRVRVEVIRAIGDVLMYGNGRNMDDVVSHLAQRLFDQAPVVRSAVTETAGAWLLDFPDRYSFFHKLLPLLLTGCTDELPAIREAADTLWHDIGIKYESENPNDLKERADFADVNPKHYPADVERPNLGCRQLVYLHISKIIPGLLRDMLDWVSSTRMKSAALLYTLLLNSEKNITQHVDKVVTAMFKACTDDEPTVVEYVSKGAELIGYFVSPEVWSSLLLRSVQTSQPYGPVFVLSSVIAGCDPVDLNLHLTTICETIASPSVCCSIEAPTQRKLVELIGNLIRVAKGAVSEVSCHLFRALVSVLAMAVEADIAHQCRETLSRLASAQSLEGPQCLYSAHTGAILSSFEGDYEHWSSYSEERAIFDTLLIESGPVVGELLDTVVPMLAANLRPDAKDPETRLKFLTLLCRLSQASGNATQPPSLPADQTTEGTRTAELPGGRSEALQGQGHSECDEGQGGSAGQSLDSAGRFEEFSARVVTEMLLPNCVWKAGRTAAAVRMTAVSCLWSLVRNGFVPVAKIVEVEEPLLTQLYSMLEDDMLDTRLVSCHVLTRVYSSAAGRLDRHRLHNAYPQLLRRLDDAAPSVRIAACRTFCAYFGCFGGDYEVDLYRAHWEEVFKGLILYLDDTDEAVQEAVLESLKACAPVKPDVLIREVEAVQSRHRSKQYCQRLIDHCRSLM